MCLGLSYIVFKRAQATHHCRPILNTMTVCSHQRCWSSLRDSLVWLCPSTRTTPAAQRSRLPQRQLRMATPPAAPPAHAHYVRYPVTLMPHLPPYHECVLHTIIRQGSRVFVQLSFEIGESPQLPWILGVHRFFIYCEILDLHHIMLEAPPPHQAPPGQQPGAPGPTPTPAATASPGGASSSDAFVAPGSIFDA